MEIQKRLILNKTPKDMPYASIPCAKNMMIDDTGSFLTNDIGFTVDFNIYVPSDPDNPGYEEYIVGIIPCNNELVIFTNIPNTTSCFIYRKPDGVSINFDNKEEYRVNTNWTWNGGKLCGSYTYNYKGELIIALGEYDVPNNKKIPMKSWNLNTGSLVQTYNIEEDIPYYDSSYTIQEHGNLVCGVYTFFIRFKIDDFNYTKWFQITGDINIIQEAQSKKYDHQFLNISDQLETPVHIDSFTVNANNISNKAIVINITFSNYTDTRFQLGYIIKRNSDVSGRIQGEYDIDVLSELNNKISIVNNLFIEEISVDSLLEVPNQFFNVKNIINYNNRLYISNYEEYPIEDLSGFALNNTSVNIDVEEVQQSRSTRTVETPSTLTVVFYVSQVRNTSPYASRLNTISPITFTIDNDGYITSANKTTLLGYIVDKLVILGGHYPIVPWNNNYMECYWFIQKSNDYSANGAICIAKNSASTGGAYGWGWNFTINNFAIKITGDSKSNLDVIIEYNGDSWSLLGKNGEHSCILGYQSSEDMWFGNTVPRRYNNPLIQPDNQMPDDIKIVVNRIGDGDDDDDPSESGGDEADSGVNTRTLHPYQKYNFFIHYIRKDGSCTLGFPINIEPTSYSISGDNTILIPKVKAKNPDSSIYVGYFITYEDIESTIDCVYIVTRDSWTGSDPLVLFTNSNYLYDIDVIRGNKLRINDVDYTIRDGSLIYKENRLTYNHVEGILENPGSISLNDNIAYWIKNVKNLYNNKTKVLYRLTKNIYSFGESIKDKDYLPAFYSKQIIILYTSSSSNYDAKELIIDPSASYVVSPETQQIVQVGWTSITTYTAKLIIKPMYSQYPTEAMNIKEDFEQAAITLHRNIGSAEDPVYKDMFRVNTLVSPDKLHDLLEIKEAYKAKPSKSYTNFNNNNIYVFDKTVRRSDVISDESLVNGFRHFEINNYKNILENKGKIVNIVGIGLYFIVHTEQSIFVFDRTPKLTAKSQLDIPDTFAIDYQDVMPSNEGFGGLSEKEEAILTKNGYVWFDKTNKIIFRYENGKATIISTDINNFLKYLNITHVRFAEDIIYNRLIVCIYFVENLLENSITLSYNFNTNTFISLHDYKFTDNFRTSKVSYLFDSNNPNVLYRFDNTKNVKYGDLTTFGDIYFPYYAKRVTDPESVTAKSYVDVIFNKDYFNIKAVNSVRYILSRIIGNNYPYKITEEQLERHFSGNEFKIYTDETDSGDLNIEVDVNKINKLDDYKHPYYDKGCWNLNYFRNLIATPVTESELRADAQRLGTNADKYVEANSADGTHLISSDSRSLIYGKYIVVRFIFNNNVNIKLEGVDINVNPY